METRPNFNHIRFQLAYSTLISVAILFWLAFCVNSFTFAQAQPRIIAEGEYGLRAPGDGPRFNWSLIELPNGNLEVHVPNAGTDSKLKQVFSFTSKFKQVGYSLEVTTGGQHTGLSCNLAKELISCDFDFKGTKSNSKLHMEKPYFFMTESTDVFWSNTGAMAQVARNPGKATDVVFVGVADRADNVGEIEASETEHITYLGTERFESVFGPVNCHVYKNENMKFWMADSGVVLALAADGEDKRIELVKLKDESHRVLPSAKH